MPKRFLEPGITTSDKWNPLKWATQSFYVRLITLVDDYGRYDGRSAILRAHAFPLRPDVTERMVIEMCEELAKNALALFYKSGDKVVVQILRWKDRPRSASKYPEFKDGCEQLFASVSKCAPPSPSPSPTSSPPPTAAVPANAGGGEEGLDFPQNLRTEQFMATWTEWVAYRKSRASCKDWVRMFQKQLDWLGSFPEGTAKAMLDQSIRNNWQSIQEVKNGNGTNQHSNGSNRPTTSQQRNAVISGAERIRTEMQQANDADDLPFIPG